MNEPTAESYITLRLRDGSVLDSKNAFQQHQISSLVKLRTAVVVRNLQVPGDHIVKIVHEDLAGRSPTFREGDEVSVEALLSAMMLYSDNVAAIALAREAERLSGKSFTGEMNSIGAGAFNNSWGSAYTSAEDLTRLLADYWADGYLVKLAKAQQYQTYVSGRTSRDVQWSNKVLERASRIPGVQFGKTGTGDFRASLVFGWRHGNERLVTVILRSRGDRFRDARMLVERAINSMKHSRGKSSGRATASSA